MLSQLTTLLVLLATSDSFSLAAPAAQATSGPALRKRVIISDLPQKQSLTRRGDDGETYANLDVIFKDLDRLTGKYEFNNNVYRQNLAKPDVQKRHAELSKRATTSDKPYDLAMHRRNKRAGVASVSLTDDVESGVDVSYYSQNLEIGTPAQTFSIDFDTGSADLWVLSSQALSSSSSSGGNGSPFGSTGNPLGGGSSSQDQHATFDPSSSSTDTVSNNQFDITYGTGQIEGVVAQDVVSLNGLSVQQQGFGVATTVTSDFIDSPFDGLMGIAFSTISQTNSRTWPENLVQNNEIPSNLFSIQLGDGSSTLSQYGSGQVLNNDSGMIIFGAVDSSAYTGDLVYSPVTIKAYWQIACDGVANNGNIISGTTFGAAIDSGTSLIYVPTSVASNIASSLGASAYTGQGSSGSGYYTLDCDEVAKASVAFSFGGTLFYINAADLSTGRVSSRNNLCMLTIIGADTTDPERNPIAIVGDSFLKNVVAVFDYNGPRVGMAAQVGANSTQSPVGSSDTSSSSSSASQLVFFAPLLALVSAVVVLLC